MKKLAPILITILTVIYLGAYAYLLIFIVGREAGPGGILFAVIGLAVLGVLIAMMFTLRQRLKEIDKEDKDDLSKY